MLNLEIYVFIQYLMSIFQDTLFIQVQVIVQLIYNDHL